MTVTVATPTAREELPARLRRVTMRLSRRLRREAGSGLPPALDSALTTIGRRGPISPSELAQLEGVRRPTATRLLAILEDRGLVARTPDPCDRRSCRVAVTEPGRALLRDSRTRRDAYIARRLASFEPDDRAMLDRALALLERMIPEER
jgi:DNA-binding MarR family transcriptional regulator